jgi:hypothetical protein
MARLLFILFIFANVMGLFSLTHPILSMQAMHMDEMTISHQSSTDHGSVGDHSTGSCCDVIASTSIGCAFLAPQNIVIDFSGGNKQVINSSPLVQSIHLETLTPPPKA